MLFSLLVAAGAPELQEFNFTQKPFSGYAYFVQFVGVLTKGMTRICDKCRNIAVRLTLLLLPFQYIYMTAVSLPPLLSDLNEVSLTLRRLIEVLPPPDPQFLEHLESGLNYRLQEPATIPSVNTYLKPYEVPQIVLFDILANRFPIVLESQRLLEEWVMQQSKGHRRLCIIDIGIGRGLQMVRLLHALNDRQTPLELTLIGIELNEEALAAAVTQMEIVKERMNYSFHFHPLAGAIETMDFTKVRQLIPDSADFLVVNASLTLHHIQSGRARNDLFRKLKTLHPDLLTLTEPNASTYTDELEKRICEAVSHFYALYHYTNTLPLTGEEKRSLKTFFSNDFFDPIALPNEARFEKLETGAQWVARAQKGGFQPLMPSAVRQGATAIPHIIEEELAPGYINFRYGPVNLLSVIALA